MSNFGFRSFVLIFFLVLWVLAALGHLLYFTVIDRANYLELGRKIAWRQGTYPASRGKIFDKNKVVIAWSEKYFDLIMLKDMEGGKREELMRNELSEILGKLFPVKREDSTLLKAGLTPENILSIQKIMKNYPELRILPRFERRCVDYPEVKAYIGKVIMQEGVMTGAGGVEQKYNETLTGTDGEYTVMVNKHEEWIRGTWKLVSDAVPGRDVHIDKTIDEIRSGTGGRKK